MISLWKVRRLIRCARFWEETAASSGFISDCSIFYWPSKENHNQVGKPNYFSCTLNIHFNMLKGRIFSYNQYKNNEIKPSFRHYLTDLIRFRPHCLACSKMSSPRIRWILHLQPVNCVATDGGAAKIEKYVLAPGRYHQLSANTSPGVRTMTRAFSSTTSGQGK